jgi:hypothetical protein
MSGSQRDRLRLIALFVVPATAMLAATFAYDTGAATSGQVIKFRAVVTAATLVSTLIWWAAARYLGKPTAWAALTVFLAASFALFFGLAADCGTAGEGCSGRDTLDWAVFGGLLPLLPVCLFIIPAIMLRWYARGIVWAWARLNLPMPDRISTMLQDRADKHDATGHQEKDSSRT